MKNKPINVEMIELEALAPLVGLSYGTLKIYVSRKLKNNEPLEFMGLDGSPYKLFGEPSKKWFAYNADKYAVNVITAPTKETPDQA